MTWRGAPNSSCAAAGARAPERLHLLLTIRSCTPGSKSSTSRSWIAPALRLAATAAILNRSDPPAAYRAVSPFSRPRLSQSHMSCWAIPSASDQASHPAAPPHSGGGQLSSGISRGLHCSAKLAYCRRLCRAHTGARGGAPKAAVYTLPSLLLCCRDGGMLTALLSRCCSEQITPPRSLAAGSRHSWRRCPAARTCLQRQGPRRPRRSCRRWARCWGVRSGAALAGAPRR